MFSLDDFEDEEGIPSEIKERIVSLDEAQQKELVKILSEHILTKYNKLSEKEQLSLDTIDDLIIRCTEEALDEIESRPVDNWKNGLDLL